MALLYADRLPLPRSTLALVGASAATSYVFFSNLGGAQFGLVPLLTGRLTHVKLTASDKIKAWSAFYSQGALWTLGATGVGAALNIFAATQHPAQMIGQLAIGAAVTGLAIVPYTFALVWPTNKELLALADDEKTAGALEDSAPGQRVSDLLQRWDARHNWRHIFYFGSWAMTLAALVYDNRAVVEVVVV